MTQFKYKFRFGALGFENPFVGWSLEMNARVKLQHKIHENHHKRNEKLIIVK